MFEWVHGRPSVLLRAADVRSYPGGRLAPLPDGVASVARWRGSAALVLGGAHLTTAIPLELGGLLLVSCAYCDSDERVSSHLDMMPAVGWETVADRFESDGSGHALFDGAHAGAELDGEGASAALRAETGGIVRVSLDAGSYEVESLGPWAPDDRTELWLTRLVRVTPAARP